LDPSNLAAAAGQLAAWRRRRSRIGPLAALPADAAPEDGYRVQQAVHETHGPGDVAGYKIGCTTAVMQRMLAIPSLCYGTMVFGAVHHRSARLAHADFIRPGIECEIAVRLGDGLPSGGAPYDIGAVAARVEHCIAAIELVDDRYADYRALGVATLIADDFFHAGCVLGAPQAGWRALDLRAVAGRMLINGAERGTGRGGDVMGHPFAAVAWLANALAARGQQLRHGDVVLSGSVVETQWVAAGDEAVIEIEGLGGARVAFT
jgi:2-keto-4-pentenoate hydratase